MWAEEKKKHVKEPWSIVLQLHRTQLLKNVMHTEETASVNSLTGFSNLDVFNRLDVYLIAGQTVSHHFWVDAVW